MPGNPPEINLSLHQKQGVAFHTQATEVLYGGAAGGGKSFLMRALAIMWAAMIPGLQIYLFRRIREDLIKNHIEGPKGLRALLAPWEGAGFVKMVDDEIRFWNGSKIYLCHCKDEKHRFKYLGAEIHVLLVDELTTFTEVIYRFLRGRVRAVGLAELPEQFKGCFPRILCSSNPGNIGHQWVKQQFVDLCRDGKLHQMPDEEGGMVRQYIPARLEDNPSMAEDDPNYRARLRGLGSESLVKAMESGDWDVIEGAYFSEFNAEKHVVSPFKIPDHWVKFRSFDWGSAKPFSVGWWAVVGETVKAPSGQVIPRGALVRYREWYGVQKVGGLSVANTGLKLRTEQVAQGIKDRTPKGEKIHYSVADPAIFTQDGGESIAEKMSKMGVMFRRADNKRIPGWTQLRDRLDGDDGRPMIYWFSTCADSIRTIPALQHDDVNPEDLDSDGEDHAADETRYACMSRPFTKSKPGGGKPIKGLKDMTMNQIWETAPKRKKGRSIA